MKHAALVTTLTILLGLGGVQAHASEPEWDKIEATEIMLFYPGIASIEWVLGDLRIERERHQGSRVFRMGDRCIECHLEDVEELIDIGNAIAGGERMEPAPIDGKPGSIPAKVQAAFHEDTLYLRFRWQQPPTSGGSRMDAENPMKIGIMLDAGKVEYADQAGCWASCHADVRSMPDGDESRTKYVTGGSLADGVFYDLLQWRSGEGKAYDGHVADTRVAEGGKALKSAKGTLDAETWTVVFKRSFAGGEGDITLVSGGVYNIGVAIHDDHAAARFHHVTMGYTLGVGADADIVAKSY